MLAAAVHAVITASNTALALPAIPTRCTPAVVAATAAVVPMYKAALTAGALPAGVPVPIAVGTFVIAVPATDARSTRIPPAVVRVAALSVALLYVGADVRTEPPICTIDGGRTAAAVAA